MKQATFLIALFVLLSTTNYSIAQSANQKTKKKGKMENSKQSKEVVQGFFTAFGKGDFDGIINSFHDSSTIIGVRDGVRNGNQVYGTYSGKEGAKLFISNLGSAFDTKAFSVQNIIGEDSVAFANGKFTHIVKSTGKTFSSDWALMCIIKDGKILEYHFYEDSEKFSKANK